MTQAPSYIPRHFVALLVAYCVASLVHFSHNAEFVTDYPNLPAWLTRSTVYGAWFAITAVGAAGLGLLGLGLRVPGLLLIAAYAALGFAGLDHYWVAGVSEHTLAMNATIWLEVAAAAALLVATTALLLRPAPRPVPAR